MKECRDVYPFVHQRTIIPERTCWYAGFLVHRHNPCLPSAAMLAAGGINLYEVRMFCIACSFQYP